jgi:hypothetical protein
VWGVANPSSPAADDLAKPASWVLPSPADARAATAEWLGARLADAAARQQFEQLWPAGNSLPSGTETLDLVVTSIARFEPQCQPVVDFCRTNSLPGQPPQFALLSSADVSPFVRNHLRLFYARWLAQNAYYDEASELLQEMKAADVLDPATLLFYQSVACHRLMQKEKCLASVQTLLENEAAVPRRYVNVARLLAADIEPLTTDSLDEVSRLMDDIRRRLQLSRAGRRVRQQEDEVIAKLDKMIEEAEKKQQQVSATSKDATRPTTPAQDSMPLGGRGPGDVDQKATGQRADWGNLPPKEREEALQEMSKDLPAHYRELIEEYFRKLARDGSK